MFKKTTVTMAVLATLVSISACTEKKPEATTDAEPAEVTKAEMPNADIAKSPTLKVYNKNRMMGAIMMRSEEERARDAARNPAKTLEFFQVAQGMSVAEALPGGGWYSKILAPYLGEEGQLHGINYNDDMWARFGFFSEEGIANAIARTAKFPEMVAEITEKAPSATGFTFANTPEELKGTVDRVLFIRALHNLNRFEADAGTMTEALATAHMLLKEDGLVGVVQHEGPEAASDEWAVGSTGYLKKSAVISAFENAGFELVGESDINENPNDLPTEKDIVWRLPPSYNGTADDERLKAKVDSIGESNRMTLLFKKASS